MLPDLESLRCFEAAAELGSFRAASRRVGLSPAAFSDRIRRLESALDTRLFERTTRKITLTEAGRRLRPQAQVVLAEARACFKIVRDADNPLPFELTIGTRYELGMSWLVPALEPLSRAAPHRTLHLYFGDSPDLLARLQTGQLDAMISSVRLIRTGLDWVHLHREEYVFCATPALLARHPVRGPADAAHHTLLDTQADLPLFRYVLDTRDPHEVWVFPQVEQLGTIAAVRHRLLDGRGVAVLPRYFIAPDLERGRLVQLFPEQPLTIDAFRLVWRNGHPLTTELRALAETLRGRPLQ